MIREAEESDLDEIYDLINSSFANEAESDLVRQLILDKDILINLVFQSLDIIVGNIVVSKVTFKPNVDLFCGAVAPLSVLSEHQSTGIGSQLMNSIIKKSEQMKMDALFVLGDPDYYKRFGFNVSNIQSDYEAKHFQELELTNDCLVNVHSKVLYSNAFSNLL